jgi:hypothetical protein
VGSIDRPVWWDEETVVAAAAAHHRECTLAVRSCYRYGVKHYYRGDVLHPLLVTSQCFIGLVEELELRCCCQA